jgi:hypothetical protein
VCAEKFRISAQLSRRKLNIITLCNQLVAREMNGISEQISPKFRAGRFAAGAQLIARRHIAAGIGFQVGTRGLCHCRGVANRGAL